MIRIIGIIDSITDWIGNKVSYLILPLIAIVAYDVIIRFITRGTVWVFDISLWIFSALFLFGFAWALLHNSHLSVDYFSEKYPRTIQLIHKLIILIVLLLPLCYFQIVGGFDDFWVAFTRGQQSVYSPWRVVVWPMKLLLPLSFAVMTLQAVSEILKVISDLTNKDSNYTPRPSTEKSGDVT